MDPTLGILDSSEFMSILKFAAYKEVEHTEIALDRFLAKYKDYYSQSTYSIFL